jgi:hypothetical protein
MLALHEHMSRAHLGDALAEARRAVEGDDAARYPAESFIALGD